jgi:hypothetical protein
VQRDQRELKSCRGQPIFVLPLYRDSATRWIFFEGLLISTFCVFADGFQGFSKGFHYPYYFLVASLKLLTNLKMVPETSSEFVRICTNKKRKNPPNKYLKKKKNSLRCLYSLVLNSHWLQGKCAKINLTQAVYGIYLTESQAASCKHLQCQNCRFRAIGAGYWKDFKISKLFQRRKLNLRVLDFFIN